MINITAPTWEFISDNNNLALLPPPSIHCPPQQSKAAMLGYGVSELTWKNGQLTSHGLDTANRVSNSKPFSTTTTVTNDVTNDDNTSWPRHNETLESIVDQAHRKTAADDLFPWCMAQYAALPRPPPVVTAPATTRTLPVEAAVPYSGSSQNLSSQVLAGTGGGCAVAASTRVESCSAGAFDNRNGKGRKRARLAATVAAAGAGDYSSRDNSVSATQDSQQITLDTRDWDVDVQGRFTETSLGSPGNTSSGNKTAATDDRDSVGNSRPQKGTGGKAPILTKRGRTAADHNQSERKRRDKINDKMRNLQKLVPHSSKTDKASMLDEVINYLKSLQSQINMMSRMGMPPMTMNPMMMPMTMHQQMHMQLMSQMGMGMGMGMGPMGMGMMDMNAMGRPNVHPNPYMSMQHPQWDMSAATANAVAANDRAPSGPTLAPAPPSPSMLPDPISTSLLAFQSQPMTLEGYTKLAGMFYQMNQPPASGAKN